MNLIDAICSNTQAKSIAELSLNPICRYQYASIYDAIDPFFVPTSTDKAEEERRHKEMKRINLCLRYVSTPTAKNFWLFGLDVTPQPRPYARTLADSSSMRPSRFYRINPSPMDTRMPLWFTSPKKYRSIPRLGWCHFRCVGSKATRKPPMSMHNR